MRAATGIQAIAIGAILLLAACGDKDPKLLNVRSQGRGPDEFAILPVKPLQLPEDIAALPEPTPGGANLTDPTPEADAAVALGGNPARAGGGDGGLFAHVGRFGTSAGIREQLAAEDLEWRRDHDGRLLERMLNVNVYYKAYADMSLDQYLELEYWRQRGVRTVSAPPAELYEK
ncbi:DUF3035 domain-containing protein [Defluviimonas sp. WL0075]|uniref:DUF3035 domain-containing protein n=1 Tax=Albidovulum sediminicola TaxID=2984331 RepID=A0ABT2Z6G0_9RHOB|nr:DUF3035 domain-containing protein [Defluviimonas sp. WL0075]MCV2866687.1 DUF3035 domain-containing protein [Defluviimonas sp. WL0075]